MNTQELKPRRTGLFEIFKKIFYILIFLQLLPFFFANFKKYAENILDIKAHVGQITIKDMIIDSSSYVKKIRSFLKNEDIEALLIKIDSPGGVAGTAQAIFNELLKFKEKKPVVVLVENLCASAAYYIAAAGNTIISTPSALIGSIGNFMRLPDVKELMKDWKIDVKFVKSGKYKTIGSPFVHSTQDELDYLQKLSDVVYDQFVSDIAKTRNLDKEKHKIWADGKIFTGTQAITLNLADKIGSLGDAIKEIKKLAKIDSEKEILFIRYKPLTGWKKFLYGEKDDNNDHPGFASTMANFINSVLDKVAAQRTQGGFKINMQEQI